MLITKQSRLPQKLISLGVLCLICIHGYAAQLLSFEGRATNPDTSVLLYVEKHQIILSDTGKYLSAYVSYSNPDGEVFAEKTLDYAKNVLTPEMMFYDKRSQERTSVSLNMADAYFKVLIESDKNRSESKVLIDEPLVVVDAGFDRLIESKWQALQKYKELDFTFLAITRGQLINFEVIQKNLNTHSVFVELHPRNFFINLLVEPISLEYALKTKRLLSFQGLTNIERFENGKRTEENHVARIDYIYEPLMPFDMSSSHSSVLTFGTESFKETALSDLFSGD